MFGGEEFCKVNRANARMLGLLVVGHMHSPECSSSLLRTVAGLVVPCGRHMHRKLAVTERQMSVKELLVRKAQSTLLVWHQHLHIAEVSTRQFAFITVKSWCFICFAVFIRISMSTRYRPCCSRDRGRMTMNE